MNISRAFDKGCAIATAIALCGAPLSCKDKDEPKPESAGDAERPQPETGKDAKPEGGLATKAKQALEIVAGPREIHPSYPIALDTLLDLVPADAEGFVVVRDLGALVSGALAYASVQKVAMESLAGEIAKTDPGDADNLRRGLAKIDELSTKLAASGIDLSAGAVLAKRKGDDGVLLVYGSAKADALPVLLEGLGATEGDLPNDCTLVASAAGYAVCANARVAEFAPGKSTSTWRSTLGDKLPGVDLDRANVVAFIENHGEATPFVVETGQGMAHLALAMPAARADLTRLTQASPATLLGIVGAGQPFAWARLSPAALTAEIGSVPAPFEAFVKSLTGEVVLGGTAGRKGFVAAIGVTDPAPTAGLISLASFGFGEIPKTLPGGSTLDVGLETVKTSTGNVTKIHAKVGGSTAAHKLFDDMGYALEAHMFAVGKAAAITLGARADIVGELAADPMSGPSDALLEALPAALAKSLRDGKTVAALHVALDAVHAADAMTALAAVAEQVPSPEPGVDPKGWLRVVTDTMAPVSSVSAWITDVDRGPILHVAMQGFGAPQTAEGKDALAAIEAIAGGADRKSTYAALATKYSSSPRAASYKARAGELGDAVASTLAASVGLMALGAMFALRVDSAVPAAPVGIIAEPPEPPPPPPPPAPPSE